jgi:DNA-binding NarL/FixJ family response regulator
MSRIVIVDDHRLLADTLVAALQARGLSAWAPPLDASAPRALMEMVLEHRPDLVLVDLDLGAGAVAAETTDGPGGTGGTDGGGLIAPLTAAGVAVLVVTGLTDRLRVAGALEQGAIGAQAKSDGFEALVDAVCAALDAPGCLDPAGRAELLAELDRSRQARAEAFAPFERLTAREREVLRELADGHTVTDLAQRWVVADTTVRTHVRGVLRKLGTSSQLGAVAAAARSGWLGRSSA